MAEIIELDVDIAAAREELKKLQEELKSLGKASEGAFGSLGDEMTALIKETQELSAVQQEAAVDVKKLEGASAGLSTRLKSTIRDTQIAGKSVGEWGEQISGAIGKMTSGANAAGKLSGAVKLIGNAVKLSGIGLLIGLVGSVITYFTKWQSGIDKVSAVLASVGAVVDVIVGRVVSLGSAIGNFFSGNWSAAADDLSASFSGIASEIKNAAIAAYDLEKAFQQLRDDSRTAGVALARQAVELGKLKAIADDDTRSISARSAAQRQANALELKGLNLKLDLAQRQLAADQANFALHKEDATKRDAAASSEIAYLNLVEESNAAQASGEQALRELRNKAAEERKKLRDQEAADERKRAELRVAVVSDEYEKELAAEQLRHDKLLADLNKYFKGRAELLELIEQAEKLHQKNVAGIFLDQLEDAQKREEELNKLRAFRDDYEKEANKKTLDAAKKNLDDIRKLQDSEIDLNEQNFANFIKVLEANGASKADIAKAQLEFDNLIKSERLKSEIEFQEGLLALIDTGDTKQIETAKNKILLLRSQLEGLSVPEKKKPGGKGNGLLDLLGIDPEDQEDFKKIVAVTVKSLQDLAAARVEAAKAAVDAAEKEVDAAEGKVDKAQESLDRELEIAKAGFASDVTNKRNAVAEAERQESEAKQRREKALADQRKAQRAQILLDSTLQLSNLATAGTSIFRATAFLGPFGVPIAIAAIGLMLGAFIKSKVAALNAVKAKQGIQGQVGKDGIIVGPSHDNGGVPLEVEGGEFTYQDGKRIAVVKKSATAQHFGLLQAINNDDRPLMAEYLYRMTGGVRRNTVPGTSAPSAGSSSSVSISDTTTHKLLEENNRLQRKIIQMEEDKVEYIDMGDHILRRSKGREQKISKRNG